MTYPKQSNRSTCKVEQIEEKRNSGNGGGQVDNETTSVADPEEHNRQQIDSGYHEKLVHCDCNCIPGKWTVELISAKK